MKAFYGGPESQTTFRGARESEILLSSRVMVVARHQFAGCAFGIISMVQIAAGRMYMEAR